MYPILTDSLYLLHHVMFYLLAHTWRQRSKSVWQMTDGTCASTCSLFSVCRHISPTPPAQTCCTLLIWTRNMNRCDTGNLSTRPRAMFGQNRATQLSLKLKSSLGGLTEVFCRRPQRNHLLYVWSTKASKENSFFFFFPALSLTQKQKRHKNEPIVCQVM